MSTQTTATHDAGRIDFAAVRADRAALVEVLTAAGAKFRGDVTPCPFHEDGHESAGVYQDEAGAWRFKCHAGGCGVSGDVLDLRAKLNGTTRAEEVKRMNGAQSAPRAKAAKSATEPASKRPIYKTAEALRAAAERSDRERGGKVRKVYTYKNDSGSPALAVLRLERADGSKTFRQCRPHEGGWQMQAPPPLWPLFNLAQVLDSPDVIITEGEKAATALIRAGLVATTNACGAGKTVQTDWTPLAGKTVYLWPDNDPADEKTGKRTGIEHMLRVRETLEALNDPPTLLWIDPDRLDLPAKGDAYDFAEHHGAYAREMIAEVLEQARPLGPLADLQDVLAAAVDGTRYAVPLPWDLTSRTTRALLPGTVTILCGSPGATKSLALMQALRHWTRNGHKAAVLELEDGRAYHLRRALAQSAGIGDVTDDDWCKANPAALAEAQEAARDEMLALQHCVHALADQATPTPEAFLHWIQAQADAGARVICIDPITLMQRGAKPWTEDEKFLFGAKRICERAGASLVLVSHPRRLPHGARLANLNMDDLAGGTAYARFSQTILFLRAHDPEDGSVKTTAGMVRAHWNRTLSVFKARNGRGVEGARFACFFNGGTLTLAELGRIEGEAAE